MRGPSYFDCWVGLPVPGASFGVLPTALRGRAPPRLLWDVRVVHPGAQSGTLRPLGESTETDLLPWSWGPVEDTP